MIRTKRHSRNAVAARARKRRAAVEWTEPLGTAPTPRKRRARFTIQIRDHAIGDSLTLNLHPSPWPNRWLCEHGQFSNARIAKTVSLILAGGIR